MAEPIRGAGGFVPRPIRSLMRPLQTAAAGMTVQQRFIEAIGRNIANAETTRTADGGPYRREVVVSSGDATQSFRDAQAGRVIYDPGHPDADASGYVTMPNVDLAQEMVDLVVARRLHEANASVFQAAKGMLRRALEI